MTAYAAGLPPIALDELTARAELLTRVDRKYVLPRSELPELLDGLAGRARVLEIDGRREFGYHSVYFDTPELDSYLGAARRRRRRFKARLRHYVDSGLQYAEVKTRGPRGTTVKRRRPYDGGDGFAPVLAESGVDVDPARLSPTLTTCYRRTTLYVSETGTRVTIDADLAWRVPGGPELDLAGRVIVETKSGGRASAADRLLWSLGHRPCPVSKYATGLAALRPGLPAHRWRPVLRRHFPALSSALPPALEDLS
ncbi:hypothetical protein HDA40_000467 [Hamadaea flava]|uniref:Polyphosphate polymerase domain-containing protein n=1 Tax=Hamadaea flava TaxID=1742688 RepID=A0ABV8M1P1_9ACTN|nr:polyphosphate polymerase domain-containing protein [Hamadaea flava]MCP2321960.1 hypothetical protein [Hamadaea flava]